eukprot:403376924
MVSKANSYIIENIKVITSKINSAVALSQKTKHCNLVAVSKTKPLEDILTVYDGGHRLFGENYVEEFLEKLENLKVLSTPQSESNSSPSQLEGQDETTTTQIDTQTTTIITADYDDIQWHFIGHLQSNKAKKLVDGTAHIPNFIIETIDSEKLATKINKECEKIQRKEKIGVLVQVLTSDEGTKHGAEQDKVGELVEFIYKKCPFLRFRGLMTMGRLHDVEGFKAMQGLREQLVHHYEIDPQSFILSMGTSMDFEEAIYEGANEARVGSDIFGARDYSKKQ